MVREKQETSGLCRLYPPAKVKANLEPALFVFSNHFVSESRTHVRAQEPCKEQTGEFMFSVWQVREGWYRICDSFPHPWEFAVQFCISSKWKLRTVGEAELEKSLGFGCLYLKPGYCPSSIFTMFIIKPLSASWTGNHAVWCLSYRLNDC